MSAFSGGARSTPLERQAADDRQQTSDDRHTSEYRAWDMHIIREQQENKRQDDCEPRECRTNADGLLLAFRLTAHRASVPAIAPLRQVHPQWAHALTAACEGASSWPFAVGTARRAEPQRPSVRVAGCAWLPSWADQVASCEGHSDSVAHG